MRTKVITIITAFVMAFTIFAVAPDKVSAASSKYWLKVNTQANVVNVYKKVDGKWTPIKVMLCSCGKKGHSTPKGTFSVKKKWRWQRLFYGVSGQYVSQFSGNYLFHSVVYKKYGNHAKCIRKEYNKLGTAASHGCVRLATMDAKWIYENCKRGTKVTIYKDKNPGPLGKPEKVKMAGKGKYGWDPTDIYKKNKKFKMKGPTITIDKDSEIQQGKTFKIKKGVTAVSPYTFHNLTFKIEVASVKFRAKGKEKYVTVKDKKVDTNKLGKYKIKYSCYSKYCGRKAATKTFYLKVVAPPEQDAEAAAVPSDAKAIGLDGPDADAAPLQEPEETVTEPAATEPADEAAEEPSEEAAPDEDISEEDAADVNVPDAVIPEEENIIDQ